MLAKYHLCKIKRHAQKSVFTVLYQTCFVSAYCGEQNVWGESGMAGKNKVKQKTKGGCTLNTIACNDLSVMMGSFVYSWVQEQQTNASWMGTHPYTILAPPKF